MSENVQDTRQSHKIHLKRHKNLKVEWATGGKTLVEMNIQRGIFQGDALSLLLFVIAMISRNHTLRKYTESYKFTNVAYCTAGQTTKDS